MMSLAAQKLAMCICPPVLLATAQLHPAVRHHEARALHHAAQLLDGKPRPQRAKLPPCEPVVIGIPGAGGTSLGGPLTAFPFGGFGPMATVPGHPDFATYIPNPHLPKPPLSGGGGLPGSGGGGGDLPPEGGGGGGGGGIPTPSPAPEPAVWLFMVIGFGLVGVMRRKELVCG